MPAKPNTAARKPSVIDRQRGMSPTFVAFDNLWAAKAAGDQAAIDYWQGRLADAKAATR